LVNLSKFMFDLLMPPKAITSLFIKVDSLLNLITPKYLFVFLFLKSGEIKNFLTFCFFLILISSILCADPIITKFL